MLFLKKITWDCYRKPEKISKQTNKVTTNQQRQTNKQRTHKRINKVTGQRKTNKQIVLTDLGSPLCLLIPFVQKLMSR